MKPPSQQVFVDVFSEQRDFFRACVARAATQLQLWTLHGLDSPVEVQPASVEEIATRIGAPDLVRVRQLLDVMVAEGWMERCDSQYQPAEQPDLSVVLPQNLPGWGQLARVVQTGRPVSAPGLNERYQAHLKNIAVNAAHRLFSALDLGSGHLVDLGGGHGFYATCWTSLSPDNTACVVDEIPRPPDLPTDIAFARVSIRELQESLNGDVVLVSNVTHLHNAETARALIAGASSQLAPGGRLVVTDLHLDENRLSPVASLYFALNMAIYTAAGDVHRTTDLLSWVENATEHAERVFVPGQENTAVVVGTTEF